jgi:serine/threonine protein kinase
MVVCRDEGKVAVTSERWSEVTQVFQEAVELSPDAREAFLAERCDGNPEVRAAVEELLRAHDNAGSFGEAPILALSTLSRRLEPGTALGPYRIEAFLGAGGMGEVFQAEDSRVRRHVALKVLPQALSLDPQRRQRFEREAQTIAALNHPNIVTLYSFEHADDLHFLTRS